jgi:hypothetical protein
MQQRNHLDTEDHANRLRALVVALHELEDKSPALTDEEAANVRCFLMSMAFEEARALVATFSTPPE